MVASSVSNQRDVAVPPIRKPTEENKKSTPKLRNAPIAHHSFEEQTHRACKSLFDGVLMHEK